jgi:hypothetical protein
LLCGLCGIFRGGVCDRLYGSGAAELDELPRRGEFVILCTHAFGFQFE